MNSYLRISIKFTLRSLSWSIGILSLLVLSPLSIVQAAENWVTTWSASPSTIPPGSNTRISELDSQTIRIIVHTSSSGESLRIRLSNVHGTKPITIGSASVSISGSGSEILANTLSTVTFDSQESVTIPDGTSTISDPLVFEVPSDADLSVSLYLAESSGFLTRHRVALETNYVSSPGRYISSEFPVENEITYTPMLTAVDVLSNDSASTIAAFGDAITVGTGSSTGLNQRWTNHLYRRIAADPSTPEYAVANSAIGGNRLISEQFQGFGQSMISRFSRDVLELSNVSHVIVIAGINDIGVSSRSDLISAQEIIEGYRQLIELSHNSGVKIFATTLLPYEGAMYYNEQGNEVRNEVNDFILNGGEFDGVVDIGDALADNLNPNRLREEYTPDNLHLNDEGHAALANALPLEWFR